MNDDDLVREVEDVARRFQRRSRAFEHVANAPRPASTAEEIMERQRAISAAMANARQEADEWEALEDQERLERAREAVVRATPPTKVFRTLTLNDDSEEAPP